MAYFSATVLGASATLLLFYLCTLFARHLRRLRIMREYGCKEPPRYPHLDPFFGSDLYRDDFRAHARGDSFATRRARFRRLGRTYRANAMGRAEIHTMEPQNIQTILALRFEKFGVGPLRQAAVEPFLGRGVFTSDGGEWAQARALLRPIFARSQIADFTLFGKHVEQAMVLIPRDGQTIDLQPIFKRLFLDTSTEFLFGESANSLLSNSEKVDAGKFLATFDRAMRSVRKRKDLGALRLFGAKSQDGEQAYAEVHQVVDDFIARAIKRHESPKDITQHHTILVDEMLKEIKDCLHLRSQLLNIFSAARDTSAIAISDVFFQLARLPDLWLKLREEVLAIREPLSFELFKSMKYLQSVLRESLRLLGPAGLSQRICLADTVLPRGGGINGEDPILVRKGDIMMINFHAMHHIQEYWGDDVEAFDPERWESVRPSWEYLPFLGGGRICPAQQMVMGQLAYILVRFVQELPSIENRDPEETFVEEIKMLCESRNGVKVAFPSP